MGERAALFYPDLPRVPDTRNMDSRVVRSQMIGAVLFGGFRGIVVDLTWIYMEHLWYHARFYKLPALYEFITSVEPSWIQGWTMGGWHMSYNMAASVPEWKDLSPKLKEKVELEWVFRGIRFMEAGSALNPDTYAIDWEIAWTYFHKLKDYKNAIIWMERAGMSSDAPHFVYRMEAVAYERMGDLETSLAKWKALRKTGAYDKVAPIRRIIDKQIARLEKERVS